MKRVLCVMMCLVLVCSVMGCGPRKTKSRYEVDVQYYLKNGLMKEAAFGLGTKPETILETAKIRVSEAAVGGEQVDGVYVTEGNQYNCYTDGAIRYYCRPERTEQGVGFLVNLDTAYGFMVGATTMTEIENALSDMKGEEGTATMEELFFMMFSMGECKKLTYTSGVYQLTFYFSESLLFATTLVNTEAW